MARQNDGKSIAVIPSRSVREALSLTAKLRLSLDLLLIHCSRPGACAFAEEMTKARPHVKIVGIVSERHRCRKCAERLTAHFRDPEDRDPARIAYCANVIEALVREQGRGNRYASGTSGRRVRKARREWQCGQRSLRGNRCPYERPPVPLERKISTTSVHLPGTHVKEWCD
jgi:hypothetical protein